MPTRSFSSNRELADYIGINPQVTTLHIEGGDPGLTDLSPLRGSQIQELSLHNCRGLRDFSVLAAMPNLTKLSIENCPVEVLDLTQTVLTSLRLENLGISISLSTFGAPASLQELAVFQCSRLAGLPSDLPVLVRLTVYRCPNIRNVPDGYPQLQTLWVEECPVVALPVLPELIFLRLQDCLQITGILSGFTKLAKLWLFNCPRLQDVPPEYRRVQEVKISSCPSLPHCG